MLHSFQGGQWKPQRRLYNNQKGSLFVFCVDVHWFLSQLWGFVGCLNFVCLYISQKSSFNQQLNLSEASYNHTAQSIFLEVELSLKHVLRFVFTGSAQLHFLSSLTLSRSIDCSNNFFSGNPCKFICKEGLRQGQGHCFSCTAGLLIFKI